MGEIEFGDPRLPERFWAKVAINKQTCCWEWTAGRRSDGYGVFGIRENGKWRTRRVHRIAYQALVGTIPEGLDCDHLCRVRHCCNPKHIEPVTRKVNLNRGLVSETQRAKHAAITHCPKGHPYSGDNLRIYVCKRGFKNRVCIACQKAWHSSDEHRQYMREYSRRRREEQRAA
jgi:hypothetical protein